METSLEALEAMPSIAFNQPSLVYESIKPQIDRVIQEVASSGVWLNGRWTRRFAEEFADWCGVSHCVPVANGTDALELAMRALQIGPGDEVITVANAGGYTTIACRLVGATPVWVDVLPETLLLDPDRIKGALSARTKLVVATHLYGGLVDVTAIRAVLDRAGRYEVRILEDCAQAHGAMRQGRRAGSFGDISAFSFYPTKNLGALGDAGAVLTDDPVLAEAVNCLRQYGFVERFHSKVPNGRNSRMDELQAAVLSVKLRYVDEWNRRRREIIACYSEGIDRTRTVVGARDPTNVGHLAVIRTPNRSAVMKALVGAGIGVDVHYPVLDCDQASQRGLPGRKLRLHQSELARNEILTLPCYPGLTDIEIDRIIAVVNDAV
jgi:dTDP-3-amino-2,3,6-trideoxy-4-keto-D-glucose/dTDP-3-amino-3,4,6-trideoxy-alpha-D-glucose/dTDP-2,6-dideoxy-D-kanosamine transaminase